MFHVWLPAMKDEGNSTFLSPPLQIQLLASLFTRASSKVEWTLCSPPVLLGWCLVSEIWSLIPQLLSKKAFRSCVFMLNDVRCLYIPGSAGSHFLTRPTLQVLDAILRHWTLWGNFCLVLFGFVVYRILPLCSVAKHGYDWSLCAFFVWDTRTLLNRRFESFFWWVYISYSFHSVLFSRSTTILLLPYKSSPQSFGYLCAGLFCMVLSNLCFQVFVALNEVSTSAMFYFSFPLVS